MTATSEIEVVELFNRLIRACNASEAAFAIAAQSVNRLDLKRLFETYAKQRRRFATELAAELARIGGVLEPAVDGSDAKAAARPIEGDSAVLSKLERVEEETMKCYRSADAIELRQPLRAVIDRQTAAVVASGQRLSERPFSKKSA